MAWPTTIGVARGGIARFIYYKWGNEVFIDKRDCRPVAALSPSILPSMPVGSNFLVSAKGLRYLIMEREENFCWTSAAHQRGAGELLNREKLPLKIGINSV